MADRYLKATGNWADNNTWSATDGGAAGATFPTAADNAYITANGNGLTLTVNVASACITLICSGGSTATLAGASNLTTSGSVTLLSTMTLTYNGSIYLTGTGTFTTGGLTMLGETVINGAGITVTLGDDYTSSDAAGIRGFNGTLTTNNKAINVGTIDAPTAGTKVLNLGSSTITCRANWDMSGANVTVNAGTSTIILTYEGGTATFSGGNQTYNKVELAGGVQPRVINQSNTFASLAITSTGNQTITFTDGTTQTIRHFTRINDTTIKTLVGTGVAGWDMVRSGDIIVDLDYLDLSYSTVTPANTWFAGTHSTDTVGNSGWVFTDPPRVTIASSPSLVLPNALTFKAWAYMTTEVTFAGLITQQIGDILIGLVKDGDNWRIQLSRGAAEIGATGTSTINLNTPYMVVGTFDGTDIKISVNGTLENTTNSPGVLDTSTNDLHLGELWRGYTALLKAYNYAHLAGENSKQFSDERSLFGV